MNTGMDSTQKIKKDQNEILVSGSTLSSKQNAGDALSDESEVIELVDVVKKETPRNSAAPSADLSEQEEESPFDSRTEIDLEELTKEMRILSDRLPDSDQDTEESLSSSDFDFETHEESYTETSTEFPDEDLEEIMSKLEQEGRTCTPLHPRTNEGMSGMTEGRMEALIREVVEKAVREAMADTAERVIKEAIETLKESLKP